MTNMKPPWAAYIWFDTRNLYLELPCASGKLPHTTILPFTEGGMAKAIKIIQATCGKDTVVPFPGTYPFASRPKATVTKPLSPGRFTEAQRASAREVLRKLGEK